MEQNNIILPTDFSPAADNALRYVRQLYGNQDSRFYLVNTYTPAFAHSRFMATTNGDSLKDNMQSVSEQGLQQTLQRIQVENSNAKHHFETISSFNILTDEICNLRENKAIDMVVVGTTGASGLKEIFLGSTTVRIIKSTPDCSVLAIPLEAEYKKPKKIAFVTDYKRNFSAKVLDPVIQLAKNTGAFVEIMHIEEEHELDKFQESNKQILHEYLIDIPHNFVPLPFYSSKANVIQRFLEDENIDVLAMVHYKHGFLEQLLREPVIRKVAFHTSIPLLVLPE